MMIIYHTVLVLPLLNTNDMRLIMGGSGSDGGGNLGGPVHEDSKAPLLYIGKLHLFPTGCLPPEVVPVNRWNVFVAWVQWGSAPCLRILRISVLSPVAVHRAKVVHGRLPVRVWVSGDVGSAPKPQVGQRGYHALAASCGRAPDTNAVR